MGKLLTELVSKVPDSQVLSDLDHTAHFAATQGGDLRRLAITSFCWGGRISWLYAAHNPQLRAAAWYGKLTGDKTLTMPKHPVDVATQLTAPVLGLYGAQDKSIPLETIETMRQALRAANADAEIVVYPEAGHVFNADYRPSYHAPSAQDGWQCMLAWFDRFGVKSSAGRGESRRPRRTAAQGMVARAAHARSGQQKGAQAPRENAAPP
ncbi:hypothetical protein SODG_003045 [Sodalis praecaptivus]